MGYSRQCSNCPHSAGGGPDSLCDIYDGYRSDRDSIHSYDEIFFDDLIIDDDDYDYF